MQELTAEDVSRNASGWLHHTCNRLSHKDMFAHIRSSETLLRIHSTAEQFDMSAEALTGPFQVSLPPTATPACPLRLPFVSLCLPFAPALCLSLSLSLCLGPNGVCFAINYYNSPVKWSLHTAISEAWLNANMYELGLQAFLQAM